MILGNIMKLKFKKSSQLHMMMIPGMVLVLIFMYYPLYGILIAFKDFVPTHGILGSKWVGLHYFKYMFFMPGVFQIWWNTFYISVLKIIFNFPVPIIVALLLNEVQSKFFKRSTQTIIYLPYFLSWVVLSGIFIDIFSLEGIANQFIGIFGINPIMFLGDNKYFVYVLVVTDVWKNFGYATVIYLAAITGIDGNLYEAATMDGANRWKQTLHITLPGIAPITMLILTLNLGSMVNAGFDQICTLYNPLVYKTADIIDTFVYRIALVDGNYSLGTAVGLLKSSISFMLIFTSYKLANRYSDYTIF